MLKTLIYVNNITIQENENGATVYSPTAGQPGFDSDTPLGAAYRIFSAPDASATLPMLGVAFFAIGLLRRKILTHAV